MDIISDGFWSSAMFQLSSFQNFPYDSANQSKVSYISPY